MNCKFTVENKCCEIHINWLLLYLFNHLQISSHTILCFVLFLWLLHSQQLPPTRRCLALQNEQLFPLFLFFFNNFFQAISSVSEHSCSPIGFGNFLTGPSPKTRQFFLCPPCCFQNPCSSSLRQQHINYNFMCLSAY